MTSPDSHYTILIDNENHPSNLSSNTSDWFLLLNLIWINEQSGKSHEFFSRKINLNRPFRFTKSEVTHHLWSDFGCRQPDAKILIEKVNKLREDYEKQEGHKFLYQIVYDGALNLFYENSPFFSLT